MYLPDYVCRYVADDELANVEQYDAAGNDHSGRVYIWKLPADTEERAGELLRAAWLQQRLEGVKSGTRRTEIIGAAMLLNGLLGTLGEIAHKADGAPWLPAFPTLQLSLSHSAGYCAAAIARAPMTLGVDIERRSNRALRIAPRFLTEQELRMLSAFSRNADCAPMLPEDAATLAWSIKESVFKAVSLPDLSVISQVAIEEIRAQRFKAGVGDLHLSGQYEFHPQFVLTVAGLNLNVLQSKEIH